MSERLLPSPLEPARPAHVHGNLFAFLNIVIGHLLRQLPVPARTGTWVSRLALAGLMPLGIVAELVLGAPPIYRSTKRS